MDGGEGASLGMTMAFGGGRGSFDEGMRRPLLVI